LPQSGGGIRGLENLGHAKKLSHWASNRLGKIKGGKGEGQVVGQQTENPAKASSISLKNRKGFPNKVKQPEEWGGNISLSQSGWRRVAGKAVDIRPGVEVRTGYGR